MVSQTVEPIVFRKVTSDPEFQISGVVLGGSVAVVSYRWVNAGSFVSKAWDVGVKLAEMVGWEAAREHQSACLDAVTCSASTGASVSSAAGNSILWRTSFDVTVGSQWHEGQLVFPVHRS